MCVLSFVFPILLSFRRKFSNYGLICFGLLVFIGLAILEMTVFVRYCGLMPHAYGIDLISGLNRIFHGGEPGWREIISNTVAFVPFGFFISEFLFSTNQLSFRICSNYVLLVAFSFSLCIECLQMVLKVGFFELTDLLTNTLGAFLGTLISSAIRNSLKRSHL